MKRTQFALTEEQFIMLQHFLPKKYCLKKDSEISIRSSNSRSAKRSPNHMSFTSNESPLPEMEKNMLINELSKEISSEDQTLHKLNQQSELSFKQRKEILKRNKLEVRQMKKELCLAILDEIETKESAQIFLQPVNSTALGIPQYFSIIKKPMDLRTMRTKVNTRLYRCFDYFKQDLEQIVWNCLTFNAGNDYFIKISKKFDQDCKKILNKNKQKIENLSSITEKIKEFSQKKNILELSGNTDGSFSSKSQIKTKKNHPKQVSANETDESSCEEVSEQAHRDVLRPNKQTYKKIGKKNMDQKMDYLPKLIDSNGNISKISIEDQKISDTQKISKRQQFQEEKKENNYVVDQKKMLSLITQIRGIPKSKKVKFFQSINLAKGQQIDFKTLSRSQMAWIQKKLNNFMKMN